MFRTKIGTRKTTAYNSHNDNNNNKFITKNNTCKKWWSQSNKVSQAIVPGVRDKLVYIE